MEWEAIGAIGEVGGAVGVIVTLIYLAGQLRQNTKALRSGSYAHWNEVSSAWASFYAHHASELSEIESHDSLDQLSPQQTKVFRAFATLSTNQAETAFLQHRAGTLDEDVFEARMRAFVTFLGQHDLLRQSLQEAGRSFNTPEFVDFVESRVSELKAEDRMA